MAGPTGLEPATSGVTGRRSSQLNYDPASRLPSAPPKRPVSGTRALSARWADRSHRLNYDPKMLQTNSAPLGLGGRWRIIGITPLPGLQGFPAKLRFIVVEMRRINGSRVRVPYGSPCKTNLGTEKRDFGCSKTWLQASIVLAAELREYA